MDASYIVLLVLSTISVGLIHADSTDLYRGYVTKTNNTFIVYSAPNDSYVQPTDPASVVAQGFWDISYNTTGWSVLEIMQMVHTQMMIKYMQLDYLRDI